MRRVGQSYVRLGAGPWWSCGGLSHRAALPVGLSRCAAIAIGTATCESRETASGGELSRVALALRAVAHAGAGEPTIVFDEIDAGIGGQTAHAVAEALGRLAERAQVLTITHLPQIASAAETPFRVEKVPGDPTHTRIERLAESARKEEVERMLGGAEFIESVRQ